MKYLKIKISQIDFWLLIGTSLFVIPLLWSSATIDPVLMPRFLAWSILTFVLLVLFLARLYADSDTIDLSLIRRGIFLVYAIYLLFSLISLIKAVNVTEGIYEVTKIFVSIVFLFITMTILNRSEKNISILTKSVIITAVLLSATGLYQCISEDLVAFGSIMANKNQLSSVLFLMLPFCLYGLFVFHKYWKIISIIPIALILVDILLLKTRSVWLAFVISTAVGILTLFVVNIRSNLFQVQETRFIPRKVATGFITVLIVSAFLAGIYFLQSPDRLRETTSLKSMSERSLLWGQSLRIIRDNSVLGVGAGNWKIAICSYGLNTLPERATEGIFFQRPHNDFLWVFSEIGFFGFVSYLFLFGIAMVYAVQNILYQSDFRHRLLSLLIFCGLIGYVTIAMFSFPKERIFHTILLLFMIAIVTSIYHQNQKNHKVFSLSMISILAILSSILLAFSIKVGYFRLRAEIQARRAFAARNAGYYSMVINEIDKGYSWYATLDATSTPLYWYRGEANYLLGNHKQAHEDFKKAYIHNPYHIHVLNNLGTSYEIIKDHEKAILYYTEAIRIWPEFEEALINLGATYYNCGRYKDAHNVLKQCKPDSSNKILLRYLEIIEKKLE